MSHRRLTLTTALALTAAVGTARAADADKAALYRAENQRLEAVLIRIPEMYRQRLSGAGRSLLARVFGPEDLEERPGEEEPMQEERLVRPAPSVMRRQSAAAALPAVGAAGSSRAVSDPSTDLDFSRLGGFSQSETSTAWCGDVVVVGFTDTGSLGETLGIPGFGISFDGVARSANRGGTFTDLGFLNPGTSDRIQLLGETVVACTDASTFYYGSLLIDFGPFTTGVSVSKSANGGLTFADPVKAVEKSLDTHFVDKEWLAVDPTNPDNLYVTYRDFDGSGSICGSDPNGDPIFRAGIELVRSTDGGTTWGPAVRVTSNSESCAPTAAAFGPQVLVDGLGTVHVAWEQLTFTSGTTGEIRIAKSDDHGASFDGSVTVASVNPAGELGDLQGGIAIHEFPTLAVDRSDTPRNGTLYLAWSDGNVRVPDPGFPNGEVDYGFADILATRSTDGGATWTPAVRVNDNVEPLSAPPQLAGRGTDQFIPGIAVDHQGVVGICFYDRRSDPLNFQIERRCARSANGGRNWVNFRDPVTDRPFISLTSQDFLHDVHFMSDYDTLASDFTEAHAGFVGAYCDNGRSNPDVRANKF